jgi:hypothetical protein
MRSINTSHIVLVPKIDNPTRVGDYRPISLLNSSIKLLTKVLANRLQQVITQLVHRNQYGFFRNRSIEDWLAWAFEYLYLCKKSKKDMIILKLDFEKTFDKLEHEVILQVMHHKGFGPKWLMWMKMIMDSGTSSIILNGVQEGYFTIRGELGKETLSTPFFLCWLLICFKVLLTVQSKGAFSTSLCLLDMGQISQLFNAHMTLFWS